MTADAEFLDAKEEREARREARRWASIQEAADREYMEAVSGINPRATEKLVRGLRHAWGLGK